MVVGSGLGATFGIGVESVYGTLVAPTRWLAFLSETVAYTVNVVQGQGLSGSGGPALASQRVPVSYDVQGQVVLEVPYKGIGALLATAAGRAAASTQQAATAAYLQTYLLSSTSTVTGKSLTLQIGRPSTDGTPQKFTYTGCKITSLVIECDASGVATMTVNFNGRTVDTTTSLTTAALSNPLVHAGPGMSILASPTVGSETTLNGVRKVTCTITNGMYDPFYAGNAGLKSEPVQNVRPTVVWSLETDYVSDVLAGYYRTQTPVSLIFSLTGAPVIATSYPPLLTVATPWAMPTSGSPQVGGPGVLQPTYTFEADDDASHAPATITYQSAETTPA